MPTPREKERNKVEDSTATSGKYVYKRKFKHQEVHAEKLFMRSVENSGSKVYFDNTALSNAAQ